MPFDRSKCFGCGRPLKLPETCVTDAPGTDELQVIDPWAPEPVWCGYCVRAHKRKEIDFLTERFLRISDYFALPSSLGTTIA